MSFLGYQSDIATYFNKSKTVDCYIRKRNWSSYCDRIYDVWSTPVVSSRCGDTVNDLVRDGIDGHLIDDYKDYNAFAEKIAPLLLDGAMLSLSATRQ